MQDVTLQNFQQEVIDASMQIPVLVDFWAPWCGPCKQLSPLLEKLEAQYGGRVKVVKVDTDAEQQLGQHFRVQSLPTVYAFVNGQPVDQFQGLKTEAQVKAFIDKLMPNPADLEFEQAMQLVQAGQIAEAVPFIKKAIALDPSFDDARLTYAQILMQQDEAGAAVEQLNALSTAAKADPQSQERKPCWLIAKYLGFQKWKRELQQTQKISLRGLSWLSILLPTKHGKTPWSN
jgi:putative thioredoxin